MKKFLLIISIFIIGLACGFIFSYGPLNAADEGSGNSEILDKLNDVSKTQSEIMAGINSIKEELKVIKIRVTQIQ